MTVAMWVLAAILQVQPGLVLEIYPDTFATQEECLETGRAVKNAGYKQELICFGATPGEPVGGPSI